MGEGHQEHHRGPGDGGMEPGNRDPDNQELRGRKGEKVRMSSVKRLDKYIPSTLPVKRLSNADSSDDVNVNGTIRTNCFPYSRIHKK